MKSFIAWDIINRIEASPNEFIGSRRVSLLDAFLFGYESIYLQVDREAQLRAKYENIPSLEEYARDKFHADNIGTRNFKSIISFSCEDEQDFFYKYLAFLKKYEQEFPTEETISYTLRETPQFEFKELLTFMRKRYPMYFGDYDLSKFRAFLDGYFLCKKEYRIPLCEFDKIVRTFTNSITCTILDISGEYVTWDRKYSYDRSWNAWGDISDTDRKNILEEFWGDLDEFTKNEVVIE